MLKQKFLKRNQLKLVPSKFRRLVKMAWGNGNDVPYGVVYLSDDEYTQEEIDYCHRLNNKYKWELV